MSVGTPLRDSLVRIVVFALAFIGLFVLLAEAAPVRRFPRPEVRIIEPRPVEPRYVVVLDEEGNPQLLPPREFRRRIHELLRRWERQRFQNLPAFPP